MKDSIMKDLRISVITPSFNSAPHLKRMIESVKSQKGRFDVEHIIFDNCSDDGSRFLLQNYANDSSEVLVRLFIEPDHGQSAAINKGFVLATGDLVCWLNADETYEPGALEKVVKLVNQHPEYDIYFGDFYYTDAAGSKTNIRRAFGFSRWMLLYYGCYIPSCATFIKRRVIENGNLLDETYRVTMDYEYYIRLLRTGYKFFYIRYPLSTFSLRDDNVSVANYARRRSERYRVLNTYSGLPHIRVLRYILFPMLEWLWVMYRYFWRKYYLVSEKLEP